MSTPLLPVAVIEAVPQPPAPQHPFGEQEHVLRLEAASLDQLFAERERWERELAAAQDARTLQANRIEYLRSPQGLATTSDADLREAAGKLIELEAVEAQARQALAKVPDMRELIARRETLRGREKALQHRIGEWRWKERSLRLLARLEEDFLEAWELQQLRLSQGFGLPGVMPSAIGIPVAPHPSGPAHTEAEIRAAIREQLRLFREGAKENAIPSTSLALTWWRGF